MLSSITEYLGNVSLDEWLTLAKAIGGFLALVAPIFL